MKRLSYPIDVQIEITERCNQRCIHCYNYWRYGQETGKDEMNISDFMLVLEKLHDCGVSVITLTGGEPFLRPEILFSLIDQSKKYNMEVGLNSNATLITKNYADHLTGSGLDHALISLLGMETIHNFITNLSTGFKKTCDGISNLIASGIKVAVNMAVSKLNQSEIYKVGEIVRELGVKTFCVTPIVPSHQSHSQYLLTEEECKKALRNLLKIKENLNLDIDTLEPIARCLFTENDEDDFVYFFGNRICSAAVSSCAISSKGNIRPCIHADKEFGNILKEEMFIVWERMEPWSNADILPSECRNCNANIICEGGCRMSAKLTCGQYNGKDMYMTNPIMNPERIKKLPKGNILNIDENALLKINPQVRSRKEKFGWIVYVDNNVEFCTENGFRFIARLIAKDSFTIKSIVKEFKYQSE